MDCVSLTIDVDKTNSPHLTPYVYSPSVGTWVPVVLPKPLRSGLESVSDEFAPSSPRSGAMPSTPRTTLAQLPYRRRQRTVSNPAQPSALVRDSSLAHGRSPLSHKAPGSPGSSSQPSSPTTSQPDDMASSAPMPGIAAAAAVRAVAAAAAVAAADDEAAAAATAADDSPAAASTSTHPNPSRYVPPRSPSSLLEVLDEPASPISPVFPSTPSAASSTSSLASASSMSDVSQRSGLAEGEETPFRGRVADVEDELVVLSWNIWFGDVAVLSRLQAIGRIVDEARPDIVALQEVTPPVLAYLLQQKWTRRFYVSDGTGNSLHHYGVVLFSVYPMTSLEIYELRSRLHRRAIFATYLLPSGATLCVSTSHLESYPNDTKLRAAQLAHIFGRISKATYSLFMGDTNMQHPDEDALIDKYPFADAWPTLWPDNPGYTVDAKSSAMAGKPVHSRTLRLDRIFSSEGLHPVSMTRLGTSPIPIVKQEGFCLEKKIPDDVDIYPSDHYGILAVLALAPIALSRSASIGSRPRFTLAPTRVLAPSLSSPSLAATSVTELTVEFDLMALSPFIVDNPPDSDNAEPAAQSPPGPLLSAPPTIGLSLGFSLGGSASSSADSEDDTGLALSADDSRYHMEPLETPAATESSLFG
ncbi:endonuclease/exonuclease/phosphatase family protein [Thecamonas trahens ATCC 50062]|uniref:Endonuclease/exonuclease/phosphatase family protein n=1 Tax=Thecamonas trahens ATCC 50062 TaxID=461836 RepID=A0A0L0DQW4_THETB|nr:endonuclease/exonuclease/phosphatase family protein [Thecamonas trahens ATCC 50062]KNC53828.1 endonuclease/exonuclease/phosphatase family protein [Thecamonas trahens ATCC 50062]|eukprot:XP_013754212.1 endonuclease/exonuclease/phosphatase family protein [Thecamonas trahens ATCC 50062]